MATLATRLQELAQRGGTEDKALRTLLNGNVADLSALATTDKSSLVGALNEIYGSVATAAGIDDATTSTSSTWSSSKTSGSIAAARSGAVADAIDDGAPASGTAWSSTKTSTEIASAVGDVIDDGAPAATASTLSASAIAAAIANAKSELIGGADTLADTLGELQALLQDTDSDVSAITTALANRVRFDAVQSLTSPQAAQARTNIGAQAAAEVGNTDQDLVAVFNAALV